MKVQELNLHDYIAVNKKWEQLWADNSVAYWFEKLNDSNTPDYAKGYKYLVHETTPYKNMITTNKSYYCKDLSQAFKTWNGLINQYLEAIK